MGDIEYGQYLGAECASCHQQTGASEGIPAINGMDAEVFVALNLFTQKNLVEAIEKAERRIKREKKEKEKEKNKLNKI